MYTLCVDCILKIATESSLWLYSIFLLSNETVSKEKPLPSWRGLVQRVSLLSFWPVTIPSLLVNKNTISLSLFALIWDEFYSTRRSHLTMESEISVPAHIHITWDKYAPTHKNAPSWIPLLSGDALENPLQIHRRRT